MKFHISAATALLLSLGAVILQASAQTDAPIESRVSAARAKSAALSPKDREATKALFSSAFQLWKSGDFKSARLGFENGLALDPANGIAHFYLAETLMRLNDRRTARAHYEMAVALAPTTQEGLKAQSALASLPAFKQRASGAAPEFPPEVPKAVQEALLNSSLFDSLPDSQSISCESESKTEIGGKPSRTVTRSSTQAGRSGLYRGEHTSEMAMHTGDTVSSTGSSFYTLAGLMALTTSSTSKNLKYGTSNSSTMTTIAIEKIEGTFFPLAPGNRFRIEYRGEFRASFGKPSTYEHSHACEIKNSVSPEQVPPPIRDDDNFLVHCQSKYGAGASSTHQSNYLCSSKLGLCAYGWSAAAGPNPPNFAGGFRYTLEHVGQMETRLSCSR